MRITLIILSLLILSGCADGVTLEQAIHVEKVGFWYGLWHGLIFPIAWFVSLFSDSTAVYALYNNGDWYDFGFFLGLGGLSGLGFFKE